MSIRDWFAGQSLIGLYAAIGTQYGKYSPSDLAKAAYLQADAMLAERDKVKSDA